MAFRPSIDVRGLDRVAGKCSYASYGGREATMALGREPIAEPARRLRHFPATKSAGMYGVTVLQTTSFAD